MERDTLSSLTRAINILECFMDTSKEWTLKSIVSHIGLPTTTAFRYLSTLVSQGYLVQDPIRKSYKVGPKLLLLCSTISNRNDLKSVAHPEMEKLSEIVTETINLSMLIDKDIFYFDKVETHRTITCNTKIGTRAPAHASSGGKLILANQSSDFIDDYCSRLPQMKPLTSKTNLDPQKLREELEWVRNSGYAIDNGEIEAELICIGAPIVDPYQKVIAAISIAGPIQRMEINMDFMISEVKKSAARISKMLGGTPY